MYKKILSWLLTFVMIFSMFGGIGLEAFGQSFTDIQNHWAKAEIEEWNGKGLISGYGDGTFKPNDNITRAEFITLINNVTNIQVEEEISFDDVEESGWYYKDLRKAIHGEYISGYEDNTFRANGKITRQEVAVILQNLTQLKETDEESLGKFTDTENIPLWSKAALQLAVQKGYLSGYKDHTLKASNYITRAESVKVLNNMFGVVYNESGVYGPSVDEDVLEVKGNITVSVQDITLQNMIIDGDLYLAEGIGEGDVTLDNITVIGETIVKGGGENSIIIKNSSLNNLLVIKKDGKIRIVAQGNTTINETHLYSSAMLQGERLNVNSFGKVEVIRVSPGQIVEFDGSFASIDVKATADIEVTGTSKVNELNIHKDVEDVTILVSPYSLVDQLNAYSEIEVINRGIILEALGDFARVSSYDVKLPVNLQPRTSSGTSTPAVPTGKFEGGTGTETDPFKVKTAEHLNNVRYYLDANFIQVADIDLGVSPWNEGEGWSPIGNLDSDTRFKGSYDGNDFQINNLTINNPDRAYLGLFGVVGHYTTTSEIKNITINNLNIAGDSLHSVGGLSGKVDSSVSIYNCHTDGVISSSGTVGYGIGGLIGDNSGNLKNSSSTVTVSINTTISNNKVGGLTGDNSGTIESCFYSGSVTGKEYVGGLAGWNGSGNIKKSYSTGNINGYANVGGIAGLSHGLIEECFSYGNVIGTSFIGGNVGNLTGTIINSYSSSFTTGDSNVGGLVGTTTNNSAKIINCYSTGIVSSPSIFKGGLLGTIDYGSLVQDSYWDTETSGLATSAGGKDYPTSAMIKSSNDVPIYVDWNFAQLGVWGIIQGSSYPYLQWQKGENIPYPPSPFAGGDGTAGNPYKVATAQQLDNVRNHLDKHFIQIADIDLGVAPWNVDEGWEPIGNTVDEFTGTYNGDEKVIENLYINRPSENFVGLFGRTTGTSTKITNVTVEGAVVNGASNTAILVGYTLEGLVEDSIVTGVVEGTQKVGGLMGENFAGSVISSKANGTVTATNNWVGGLIGYATFNAVIEKSSASVTVSSPEGYSIGGLIGHLGGTVEESFATGSTTGKGRVGGLIGNLDAGQITDCYATGGVVGTQAYVGGIVGVNMGTVSNCYAIGSVDNGTYMSGGIAGANNTGGSTSGTVTSSYYNSETTGQSGGDDKGIPKTTLEMKTMSTYTDASWIFLDTWTINTTDNDGYPALQWQGYSHEGFAGGTGTELDPYQVKTASHLNNVRNYLGEANSDKFFRLENDIDLLGYLSEGGDGYNDGAGWLPLGQRTETKGYENFTGVFDGNGKTISNLDIYRPEMDRVGLFRGIGSSTGQGKVVNLNIEDTNITGRGYVGVLAGRSTGSIEAITINGTVVGYSDVGGVLGLNDTGSIKNSTARGSVTTNNSNGQYIGGIAGRSILGSIESCVNESTVVGAGSYTGGLAGQSSSLITRSSNMGNVTGNSNYTGGLTGRNEGRIEYSYNTGNVTGIGDNTGGVAGYNVSSISDSYNCSRVEGAVYTGGLVGRSIGTAFVPADISRTYSIGAVSGGDYTGGLIGSNESFSSVGLSFWDIQTSNQDISAGGEGKTTVEMKQKSTYPTTGTPKWDFDTIWNIDEGSSYPYLRENEQIPHPQPPIG